MKGIVRYKKTFRVYFIFHTEPGLTSQSLQASKERVISSADYPFYLHSKRSY